MLRITWTSQFKKEYKLAKRRKKDLNKLHTVLELLSKELPLDERYQDHALTGKYSGYRELEPDWLLIYRVYGDILMLSLTRTGTHSDLF